MTKLEVLIVESLTINGLATSAVAVSEVSLERGPLGNSKYTLDHKVRNNSVEDGTLVVKGFARLADALLTSAQGTEVLNGLRNSLAVTRKRGSRKQQQQEHTDQRQYGRRLLRRSQYQSKPCW